jgi:hypothetical protein
MKALSGLKSLKSLASNEPKLHFSSIFMKPLVSGIK